MLRSEKASLLNVKRGGRVKLDSTWFHPKLAIAFSRWLADTNPLEGGDQALAYALPTVDKDACLDNPLSLTDRCATN